MNVSYTTVKKMIPPSVRRFFKPVYHWFGLRGFTEPTFTSLQSADVTVSLQVDPTNGVVDEYIFMHHQWEEEVAQVIAAHLHTGAVFVDVGANIGAFAIPMAKKVSDSGRVFAFEPHPKLVQQIKNSVQENKLANVTVIQKACGAVVGEQALYLKPKNSGGSSLIQSDQPEEGLLLSVTTLDSELSALEKIDLIKIDVEGYELEVLQGGRTILSQYKPTLVIEFSPSLYESRSKTMGFEILQLLVEMNYTIWEIERGIYIQDVANYVAELGLNQVNILCTVSKD